MRMHPIYGEQMIYPILSLRHLCPTIRGHHERWNGKGYPDGLKGESRFRRGSGGGGRLRRPARRGAYKSSMEVDGPQAPVQTGTHFDGVRRGIPPGPGSPIPPGRSSTSSARADASGQGIPPSIVPRDGRNQADITIQAIDPIHHCLENTNKKRGHLAKVNRPWTSSRTLWASPGPASISTRQGGHSPGCRPRPRLTQVWTRPPEPWG